MDGNKLLDKLALYPVASECLSDYVRWLVDQSSADLGNNSLIYVLKDGEPWQMEHLEECLGRAKEILGLSTSQFRRTLGFTNNLMSLDPHKIDDIIAEPIMVVILADSGFHDIRKLPRFLKEAGKRVPAADLIAERAGIRYAIEVKTVRVENNPPIQSGVIMGDPMMPAWWREMFHNNVITKIEDKNRRSIQQLINVQRHFGCDSNILALYYRRLGPPTLMCREEFEEELMTIQSRHPEIDRFLLKPQNILPFFFPALD